MILLQALMVATGVMASPQAASVPVADPAPVVDGRITDAYGDPLPGTTVTFVSASSGLAASTRSGADGAYVLRNVPAGPGRLRFELESFVTEEVLISVAPGDDVIRRNISLFVGRLDESDWLVRGHVVDAGQRALADASVWVDAIGSTKVQLEDIQTSADGSFEARLRYPGDYVVCARLRGRLPSCAAVRVLLLPATAAVTLVLEKAVEAGQ
jgi:hypothetical protein